MLFQIKFCIVQIIFGFSLFQKVTLRSKPFNGLVSIQNDQSHHLCGGILLDLDFVITSASCLIKFDDQFYESDKVYTHFYLGFVNESQHHITVVCIKSYITSIRKKGSAISVCTCRIRKRCR